MNTLKDVINAICIVLLSGVAGVNLGIALDTVVAAMNKSWIDEMFINLGVTDSPWYLSFGASAIFIACVGIIVLLTRPMFRRAMFRKD